MILNLSRMDLDDAGGNPEQIATAIHEQAPGMPDLVPIEKVAEELEIAEIRYEFIENLDGALVTDEEKSIGSVLINKTLSPERKRYTIAHELGHFLNPYHTPPPSGRFNCSAEDLAKSDKSSPDKRVQQEVEANRFAAELLMPRKRFIKKVRRLMGLDLEHVLQLAGDFGVSKEAAARRYVKLQDEPCAVVFSRNGVIRYPFRHDDFPWVKVTPGDPMPQGASARTDILTGSVTDWEEAELGVWCSRKEPRQVITQTLAQQNGFRMTLLALADDEELEEEDELEASWTPHFKR
ncbi:MAG: ImmA/IrrE family metallo-endopeptidase [Magnetovibrionaceae bacterium]